MLDAESVHEMAMGVIERGSFRQSKIIDPRLRQTLFGVEFDNPIGLAAGFDKNAVAIEQWSDLGFGFTEIGTVTNLRQPGNPRPRLFRLPRERALINRMGFNNDGSEAISVRLRSTRSQIPLGINIGKSRIAALEDSARDLQQGYQRLHGFGDYFVVNVSSPNTPGLRSLQERGPLVEILRALRSVDGSKPLFVKIAPDLTKSALDELIGVAIEEKLTGLIATNTTTRRDLLSEDPGITGGLSGVPLREVSDGVLAHLARNAPPELILIGVGGIFTGDDVYRKISLGAHLVQMYTGWIYGGPQTVATCLRRLLELMEMEGMRSLEDLRGSSIGRT